MKFAMLFGTFALLLWACTGKSQSPSKNNTPTMDLSKLPRTEAPIFNDTTEYIILGGGCFWCIEAPFDELVGVSDVRSGYAGGWVKNPPYREVCEATTGHAEVIQVAFNPNVISLEEILVAFFTIHDPTTLNRQGNDAGPQYRSAIYFFNDAQREVAEKIIDRQQKEISDPIVTEVTPFTNFYEAEDYHQEYFKLNGTQPYCSFVIAPKMQKFRKLYKDRLKTS